MDLPDISKELESLEILKNKFNELNAMDIDYNSPEIKKHYQEIKKIDTFIALISEIQELHNNCQSLLNLKNDKELWLMAKEDLEKDLAELHKKIQEFYEKVVENNSENYDEIIIEIRAGTGGAEAALFGGDLLKLYSRYCEKKGFSFEIVEISQSELGGIKSCSISIVGDGVFKDFQFEAGVHRVQRIPETEANGRIHTSTITVALLPCEEDIDININPNDIKLETYRAGGAGGQHVNKTDSAVRLTHIPSGIVTQCQDERSQIKNKDKAMKILKAKLKEAEKERSQQERNKVRDQHIGTGERSEKSRTYNYPQNRITDHTYNVTLYQLDFIMQGNLDNLTSKLFDEYNRKQLELKAKSNLCDLLKL
jgi:peptide chain release factor 1